MILLTGLAQAGVLATGGFVLDTPSQQAMVGPQLVVTCEREQGFCWTGRFLAGVDVRGNGIGGITEIGGLAVIESPEDATIRVGLAARAIHIQRDLPIIMQWDDAREPLRYGMVPQVLVQGELAWFPEEPLVVGANVGASPWAGVDPTCTEDDPPELCVDWATSFAASFWGRKTLKNGLTFQAGFGTLIEAGVGYTF